MEWGRKDHALWIPTPALPGSGSMGIISGPVPEPPLAHNSLTLNRGIVKPCCKDHYFLRIYRKKPGEKIFWDTAFIDARSL
jgi:hypothetical protein